MPTISGNFNTSYDEIVAVEYYLNKMGYDVSNCTIKKNDDPYNIDWNARNAGDIKAVLPDGRNLLFEVKQEAYKRFSKYGELGIDYISKFNFKVGANFRKGIHKPWELNTFLNSINVESPDFKWGKLYYSQSDVWLFYCKNPDGSYMFCDGYDYFKMKRENIASKIMAQCPFAVNNKSADQMSYGDPHESATFFVKPSMLDSCKLTKESLDKLWKW